MIVGPCKSYICAAGCKHLLLIDDSSTDFLLSSGPFASETGCLMFITITPVGDGNEEGVRE